MSADKASVRPGGSLVWTGDIMGRAEVLELLGVSRQMMDRYRREYGFPEPVARVSGSPIWLRSQVEPWLANHRRRGLSRMPENLRSHQTRRAKERSA